MKDVELDWTIAILASNVWFQTYYETEKGCLADFEQFTKSVAAGSDLAILNDDLGAHLAFSPSAVVAARMFNVVDDMRNMARIDARRQTEQTRAALKTPPIHLPGASRQ